MNLPKWRADLPAGRQARTIQPLNMFYVYILRSLTTGEFYKGLTDNLERRLQQHFAGKVRYTKNILPLKLIYVELCTTREDARDLEKFFKSGYGREIIKELAELVS